MDEHEKLRRIEGDLELIQARIGGVQDTVMALTQEMAALVRTASALAGTVADMRTPVSHVPPVDDTRKVWVSEVPAGDEYGVGPCEVMIEQFGNRPVAVAFRRDRHHTWSRPYRGEQR